VLAFGETAELRALGKDKAGKEFAVNPVWNFVEGYVTLGKSESVASDWDFEGDMILRALLFRRPDGNAMAFLP